jgi:hypothetical protein
MKKAFADTFATPRALTQIDGVDIHDSIRLEAEGITDIPSLAKSDIVSTMVSTRVPIDRLVDWTDQAVLILLLDDAAEELDDRVSRLRGIGIRTASAIVAANDVECDADLRATVEGILSGPAGAKHVITLSALATEIRREPAMQRILHWYDSEHDAVNKKCDTITVRADATSRTRAKDRKSEARSARSSAPLNGDHAESVTLPG